jgi:hypothetical protein
MPPHGVGAKPAQGEVAAAQALSRDCCEGRASRRAFHCGLALAVFKSAA